MIFGTKRFKNGKQVGYLEFLTGKRIFLNVQETREVILKLQFAEFTGRNKLKMERD